MKSLRIHYLQHVAFEGLGYLETWAKEKGHSLTATKFYEQNNLPSLSDFDLLVVMGGPMGVYDEAEFSWLIKEKEFIKQSIGAGKMVLGICLGAQLIASVLGAKIYPVKKKEIGWFPITKTTAGKNHSFIKHLPEPLIVFHWHGDTFDLPVGAVHLLQTDNCPNQAFLYDEKVLGLQFHLEATSESISSMIANGRHELVSGEFIQDESIIIKNVKHHHFSNSALNILLNHLADEK